jgi:protein TonB
MLRILPESRPRRARRTGGTALSIMVHGAVIAAVAGLTTVKTVRATSDPVAPTPIYVPAPAKAQPAPPQPHSASGAPSVARIPLPIAPLDHLPPIKLGASPVTQDIVIGNAPDDNAFRGRGVGETGARLTGGPPGDVIDEKYVDRAPFILGTPVAPRYPAVLRANGMSGRVVARFVVDTAGRAELPGIELTESSHSLFGEAVREALARYRFAPGEAGGHKVRTMVQMPFIFEVR